MSDETSLREDISFLRQMAESGRKGPILGGIFLAAAGVVFGLTCVVSWMGYQHLLPIGRSGQLPLWLGAFAIFAVFWLAIYLHVMRHNKPAASASNATFGTIWGGCGIGMMVAFAAMEAVTTLLNAPVVQAGFVPTVFAFYGTAWFASGALAQRKWMFVAAAGSFVFAFVMALLTDTLYQTLAMGGGLLLLLTVPGIKLMADESRP